MRASTRGWTSIAVGGLILAALCVSSGSTFGAEQDTVDAGARPVPQPTVRDPFRPFTLEVRPKKMGPPKTPLQQYDLGALNLVAVIWDTANPKAMVEDATGLGYTISVGTPIGTAGGVVKTIEPDRVVVDEEFVDFYGEKKKTERVLKLKPEGEKRP